MKRYERSGKNLFWSIRNSGEKINLKLEISMRPACLLMIFLLFTLHYLIIQLKIKVLVLLKEPSIEKDPLTLHVTTEAYFTSEKPKRYHALSCQNVCNALTFLLYNIFILFWHQVV